MKVVGRSLRSVFVLLACAMFCVSGCGQWPASATLPSNITTSGVSSAATHIRVLKSTSDGHWLADPRAYDRTLAVVVDHSLRVPILMYHDLDYLPGNSLGMAPHQFADEMRFLHDHGFHTINFGQLYAALYHGYVLPPRPVVLTFDDGYESVYTEAYPILKEYGFQGTIFMISGAVGHRGKYPLLSWNELETMQQSGVMDVESHTVHHVDLGITDDRTNWYELKTSADTLSQHLHHPILYFCYPSGHYRDVTLRDLKAAGYLLAVTEHPGLASAADGPYELHRIRISEGMPLREFAALVGS